MISRPRTLVFGGSREDVMKTRYTVVLSMIAGAAVGAGAIQGLHAQAKPKAYLVTESEILDRAALESYGSGLASAMQAAGGHWIGGASGPTDKITAVIGDPPKRFGVTEFDSIDKAQSWLKSSGREAIAPQRTKAVKITRQFIFEGK
jgi:uncharacterized protein (DUF1330 family)